MDTPNVHAVIHWGAPRTFEGYFQESGRGGRNSEMEPHSQSIVYYHAIDVSSIATDKNMSDFCVNSSKICRRKLLVEHFSPGFPAAEGLEHYCCDICHEKCVCGDCPSLPGSIFTNTCDDADMLKSLRLSETDAIERSVTNHQIEEVKAALEIYRDSSINESSLIGGEVLTGLDDNTIDSIVSNVHHIHQVDD